MNHKKIVYNNEKLIMCEQCETCFGTVGTLKTHVSRVHMSDGEKKFKCNICGKYFPCLQDLKAHVLKQHGDSTNRVNCNICSVPIRKSFYANHLKVVHDNVKQYQCEKV